MLIAAEEAVRTPLGELQVNLELASLVRESVRTSADLYMDNTVEVQLPFVAELQNSPRIVHLRCPPSALAVELGELLAGLQQVA